MESLDLIRYGAGALIVLGMLAGFAVAARQGWLRGALTGLSRAGRSEPAITVRAAARLDGRRRVVLIQAGGMEHLVLLSPAGDLRLQSASTEKPPKARALPEAIARAVEIPRREAA